ncbi:MAG: flagellar biosynthetic protein FliO [Janthinobacterium lividum]
MIWSYLLKLAFLLPLVCGLMVGCLYLWRRLEGRMPGKPATRLLKVTETMMISPGLRLAVLEFEGRRLLVSVGRGGVNLVDRSPDGQAPVEPAPAVRMPFERTLGERLRDGGLK